jgi:negative regulator of sigma-B (phosphoserine phosphatase)
VAEPRGRELLEWGVAMRPRLGEAVCGDAAVVTFFPDGALVAAVDGLGHGAEAARAARTAAAVVSGLAGDGVVSLVRGCHEALRQTRGAAMSVASFSASASTITWLAIGNVEGRLVVADSPRGRRAGALPLQSGLAGRELPPLRPVTRDVRCGDVLFFATDGIKSDFADRLEPSGSSQRMAERVLAEHGKASDDALVVVARYVGLGT